MEISKSVWFVLLFCLFSYSQFSCTNNTIFENIPSPGMCKYRNPFSSIPKSFYDIKTVEIKELLENEISRDLKFICDDENNIQSICRYVLDVQYTEFDIGRRHLLFFLVSGELNSTDLNFFDWTDSSSSSFTNIYKIGDDEEFRKMEIREVSNEVSALIILTDKKLHYLSYQVNTDQYDQEVIPVVSICEIIDFSETFGRDKVIDTRIVSRKTKSDSSSIDDDLFFTVTLRKENQTPFLHYFDFFRFNGTCTKHQNNNFHDIPFMSWKITISNYSIDNTLQLESFTHHNRLNHSNTKSLRIDEVSEDSNLIFVFYDHYKVFLIPYVEEELQIIFTDQEYQMSIFYDSVNRMKRIQYVSVLDDKIRRLDFKNSNCSYYHEPPNQGIGLFITEKTIFPEMKISFTVLLIPEFLIVDFEDELDPTNLLSRSVYCENGFWNGYICIPSILEYSNPLLFPANERRNDSFVLETFVRYVYPVKSSYPSSDVISSSTTNIVKDFCEYASKFPRGSNLKDVLVECHFFLDEYSSTPTCDVEGLGKYPMVRKEIMSSYMYWNLYIRSYDHIHVFSGFHVLDETYYPSNYYLNFAVEHATTIYTYSKIESLFVSPNGLFSIISSSREKWEMDVIDRTLVVCQLFYQEEYDLLINYATGNDRSEFKQRVRDYCEPSMRELPTIADFVQIVSSCSDSMFCPSLKKWYVLPIPEGEFAPIPFYKEKCTVGYYCRLGVRKICPPGFYCGESGLSLPVKCEKDIVEDTKIITCAIEGLTENFGMDNICPMGKICPNPYTTILVPSGHKQQFISLGQDDRKSDLKVNTFTPCKLGDWCLLGAVGESAYNSYFPSESYPKERWTCPLGGYCPRNDILIPIRCSYELPGKDIFDNGYSEYCEMGTYQLTLCPAGHYCEGPIEKKKCSKSSSCLAGSLIEKPCPPGYFCETPEKKEICPYMHFCPVGSTKPKSCGLNFFCVEGSEVDRWNLINLMTIPFLFLFIVLCFRSCSFTTKYCEKLKAKRNVTRFKELDELIKTSRRKRLKMERRREKQKQSFCETPLDIARLEIETEEMKSLNRDFKKTHRRIGSLFGLDLLNLPNSAASSITNDITEDEDVYKMVDEENEGGDEFSSSSSSLLSSDDKEENKTIIAEHIVITKTTEDTGKDVEQDIVDDSKETKKGKSNVDNEEQEQKDKSIEALGINWSDDDDDDDDEIQDDDDDEDEEIVIIQDDSDEDFLDDESEDEGEEEKASFTTIDLIILKIINLGLCLQNCTFTIIPCCLLVCCIIRCWKKHQKEETPIYERKRLKLDLAFKNLTLKIKGSGKMVLNRITGILEHSKVTAVMGLSGSGKTSFLNALAGNAYYGNISGEVLVNGFPIKLNKLKKVVCFVPQEDIMLREATVVETLTFSSRTRLPDSWSGVEKSRLVDHVIKRLGLVDCMHSKIGDEKKRGISGGERKRVNIGMELVGDPIIFFLDEPTSGLDSSSAQVVCDALKGLARENGLNIITVIHQPRFEIFQQFDNLLLLGKGGRTVYCGPIPDVEKYFEDIGFVCPERINPADFLMDCISGREKNVKDGKKWKDNEFVDEWSKRGLPKAEKIIDGMVDGSFHRTSIDEELFVDFDDINIIKKLKKKKKKMPHHDVVVDSRERKYSISSPYLSLEELKRLEMLEQQKKISRKQKRNLRKHRKKVTMLLKKRRRETEKLLLRECHTRSVNSCTQLYYSLWRSFILRMRGLRGFFLDNLMMIIGGAILGFLNMGLTLKVHLVYSQGGMVCLILSLCSCVSALVTFGDNKHVFIREQSSGLNVIPHYFSQILVDMIPIVIGPFVFITVVYFMATPQGNFGMYYLISLSINFTTYGLGYVISLLFSDKNDKLAALVIVTVLNLFGGILQELKSMEESWPFPIKYLPYTSFPLYAIASYFIWELKAFGDIFEIEDIIEEFGFKEHWGYWGFAVILLFGVFFRCIAYCLLKGLPPDSNSKQLKSYVNVKMRSVQKLLGKGIYSCFNYISTPCRKIWNVKPVEFENDDEKDQNENESDSESDENETLSEDSSGNEEHDVEMEEVEVEGKVEESDNNTL